MKAVLAVCVFCVVVAAGTLRVAPTQAQSSGVTAHIGPASCELPVLIEESLDQLKASFRGADGLLDDGMDGMQKEVERNRSTMDTILTYSKSSDENATTLADHLCASLDAYAERFKPGKEIDEQTLRLIVRPGVHDTQPDYGLNVEAYLLLEVVAQQERAPSFIRRALSTLYDVVLAQSYLGEKITLYKHPGHADEVAREKKDFGGYGMTIGAETAWCCERFMVDEYLADEPHIPEPGMAVVTEYWRWRKETMVGDGSAFWLPRRYQHRTMGYVKKLVAALPAEVEVAEGETVSGVDFVLSPQSEVKGQVLGPGGQPAVQAQVIVWYPVPGYGWKRAHGWSDDAGHFSIRIHLADLTKRVNVGAMKPGLGVEWTTVSHAEPAIVKLGVNTTSCAGVVTNPQGHPVAGAQISVYSLNRSQSVEWPAVWLAFRDDFSLSVTTAEDGKFEISGLPADSRAGVVIAAEGYARLRPDDFWPAGSTDLRVVLQPEATISGRVTRDGKSVSAIDVFCQSGERTVTHGRTTTVSAKDGSYKLRGLSAATYAVMVNAPEGFTAVAADGIALKAGEHFTGANLELITGGVIRGTVREAATGKPVPAASIGVSGPARPWSSAAQSVASDENGVYIVRLPAGRSRLYYVGDAVGFPGDLAAPQVSWVEVVDGQTVNGVDFVLSPQSEVKGQVLGPGGQPLADILGTSGDLD